MVCGGEVLGRSNLGFWNWGSKGAIVTRKKPFFVNNIYPGAFEGNFKSKGGISGPQFTLNVTAMDTLFF